MQSDSKESHLSKARMPSGSAKLTSDPDHSTPSPTAHPAGTATAGAIALATLSQISVSPWMSANTKQVNGRHPELLAAKLLSGRLAGQNREH